MAGQTPLGARRIGIKASVCLPGVTRTFDSGKLLELFGDK